MTLRWATHQVVAAMGIPTTSSVLGFPFTVAFAEWIPPDVSSVQIRFGTRGMGASAAFPSKDGCKLAVGTHDGNYGYAGAPVVVDPFTLPAGGVDYISVPLPVTRGADGRILAVVAIPTGTQTGYLSGGTPAQRFGRCNSAVAQVNPLPALVDCSNPLCFKVVYSTHARRLVVLGGDSIAAGFHARYEYGAFRSLGPLGGIAVDNRARNGYRLDGLVTDADVYIFDDARVEGAADVWIALGTNDLHGVMTLETMQANALRAARNLTGRGATKVYFSTVPPSVFVTSTGNEPNRTAYNAWLKTLPTGIYGVADLDPLLQSAPGVLNPIYDFGDGTHWNEAGQQAVAPVILAALNQA